MSSSHRRDEYARKLKTPQWAEFRERIFSEDREFGEYPCEYCGDLTWGRYHAHHRGYVSGREPWQYIRHEMSILCRRCHDDIHTWLKRIESTLGKMDRRLASAIRMAGICYGHQSRSDGDFTWGHHFAAFLKSIVGGFKPGRERLDCIATYRYRYDSSKSFADFRNSMLRFSPLELDLIEFQVAEMSNIGLIHATIITKYLWHLKDKPAEAAVYDQQDREPVLIGEIDLSNTDNRLWQHPTCLAFHAALKSASDAETARMIEDLERRRGKR